ncbi:MAG: hypothetical protein A3I88_03765 [Candidatus Portnoybacteria bacterium RIFCSPLOWO2_12_FULL_39_9]|uniref:VanZ-like domain-containing protein n=1 Tax=Candidatus Portnoybacteria bacterium RIFCSPHIGHO2_12_FULL_38_9 TaxID=1801997 RepID=A0A1G2FG45_9BACT|nr:MAG: hypothetical protein A3H00_03040 [Candidatus Portnoybacteria bacterium RBG_13_40_8]OGZ37019.1 MAG: hypothetical protein A3J64_01890 [Candidatus Portnoybacteria bacterium RIFCSPHIGHO2_12_FULL_38_9]OGZ38622.1 MAG: hypothetical protein A3F21_01210 [Candidatus Portnoybacteria bacterium RIFCSPLOWO2_01_FULL_38_39]OGZ40486.1 MAG: hypothetical protein A3I88_03765 [Candidatus Portnoybacteria bacterium RIFCSPLOWO2_12_FULL_39_9]
MKNWFLVVIWMGFIFFLSHQPDLKSGLSGNLDFIFRKTAHFLEYAVLTWLFFRAFRGTNLGSFDLGASLLKAFRRAFRSEAPKSKDPKSTFKSALILAIFFSILYSFSDEWHQSFVFGRDSSLGDVGVDSFGVISAAWLIKRKMVRWR